MSASTRRATLVFSDIGLDVAGAPLEVAPAPLARLRGEHRIQLLIKSRSRKQLRAVIDQAMKDFEDEGKDLRSVTLEIDPVSMM